MLIYYLAHEIKENVLGMIILAEVYLDMVLRCMKPTFFVIQKLNMENVTYRYRVLKIVVTIFHVNHAITLKYRLELGKTNMILKVELFSYIYDDKPSSEVVRRG